MSEVVRAGLACPHRFALNRFGFCNRCKPKKETSIMARPKKLEIREGDTQDLEDLDDTPKGRNREIPGTERKVIKAVKLAAARYVEARDERMRLGREELKRKAILIDRMKEHHLTEHVDDALKVIFTSAKENVKVISIDDEADDGGEE